MLLMLQNKLVEIHYICKNKKNNEFIRLHQKRLYIY